MSVKPLAPTALRCHLTVIAPVAVALAVKVMALRLQIWLGTEGCVTMLTPHNGKGIGPYGALLSTNKFATVLGKQKTFVA